jgi:membrane protein implicated in regulation of membrane protease activity
MNGKAVVTGFLFLAGAFVLFALLFGLYPPAANSPLTLAGFLAYAVLAVWATRRMARK